MKKYSFIVLIISSLWFIPVSAIISIFVSKSAICVAKQCEKELNGDIDPYHLFHVIVSTPQKDGSIAILPVPLDDLNNFFSKHTDASLILDNHSSKTTDESWKYKVIEESPDEQIISASALIEFDVDVKYKVTNGHNVYPLTFNKFEEAYWNLAILLGLSFSGLLYFIGYSLKEKQGKK